MAIEDKEYYATGAEAVKAATTKLRLELESAVSTEDKVCWCSGAVYVPPLSAISRQPHRKATKRHHETARGFEEVHLNLPNGMSFD